MKTTIWCSIINSKSQWSFRMRYLYLWWSMPWTKCSLQLLPCSCTWSMVGKQSDALRIKILRTHLKHLRSLCQTLTKRLHHSSSYVARKILVFSMSKMAPISQSSTEECLWVMLGTKMLLPKLRAMESHCMSRSNKQIRSSIATSLSVEIIFIHWNKMKPYHQLTSKNQE